MPLLDHFHPPVRSAMQWGSFASAWTNHIGDQVVALLPDEFLLDQAIKPSVRDSVDVDATRHTERVSPWYSTYQPGEPFATRPTLFPDRFEVLVSREFGGRHLVAAIEIVAPGNKEPAGCVAFASKVASYLYEGISVLVVDVVTERRANLHDEIVRLMGMPDELRMPPDPPLYAAAYRPVLRDGRAEIDVWVNPFSVGDSLPTMPLRLIADYFVPVELEATYMETCRRRKLTV